MLLTVYESDHPSELCRIGRDTSISYHAPSARHSTITTLTAMLFSDCDSVGSALRVPVWVAIAPIENCLTTTWLASA